MIECVFFYVKKCSSTTDMRHSSSGYGAIAQLGERVLCKHEVVGSIPSGSTTLRLEAHRAIAESNEFPLRPWFIPGAEAASDIVN